MVFTLVSACLCGVVFLWCWEKQQGLLYALLSFLSEQCLILYMPRPSQSRTWVKSSVCTDPGCRVTVETLVSLSQPCQSCLNLKHREYKILYKWDFFFPAVIYLRRILGRGGNLLFSEVQNNKKSSCSGGAGTWCFWHCFLPVRTPRASGFPSQSSVTGGGHKYCPALFWEDSLMWGLEHTGWCDSEQWEEKLYFTPEWDCLWSLPSHHYVCQGDHLFSVFCVLIVPQIMVYPKNGLFSCRNYTSGT